MSKQDEPAYMLAARQYVRYGDKVFTIGPSTVQALLQRIDSLERVASSHAALMGALYEAEGLPPEIQEFIE